jgi:hypothetical protein
VIFRNKICFAIEASSTRISAKMYLNKNDSLLDLKYENSHAIIRFFFVKKIAKIMNGKEVLLRNDLHFSRFSKHKKRLKAFLDPQTFS